MRQELPVRATGPLGHNTTFVGKEEYKRLISIIYKSQDKTVNKAFIDRSLAPVQHCFGGC